MAMSARYHCNVNVIFQWFPLSKNKIRGLRAAPPLLGQILCYHWLIATVITIRLPAGRIPPSRSPQPTSLHNVVSQLCSLYISSTSSVSYNFLNWDKKIFYFFTSRSFRFLTKIFLFTFFNQSSKSSLLLINTISSYLRKLHNTSYWPLKRK